MDFEVRCASAKLFAGQYYDSETGLHYNYFRGYDPATGRYVQSDPIGLTGGLNTYGYVAGNPMKYIDLNGLEILNPNKYKISDEMFEALKYFNQLIGCDKDIVITSGNRSKNSKTGKGSSSKHAKNLAADFNVPGQTHLRTANQAIDSGLFNGVGWYQEGYYNKKKNEGPHVHVDLRNPKNAAVWGYDINGNYYNWRSGGIPKLGGDLLNWSENPCGSCNK